LVLVLLWLLEGGGLWVWVLVLVLLWLLEGGGLTVLVLVLLVVVLLLGGGVAVEVTQPVASTTAQLVAQPRPLHFSWQGKDVYDVAGGFGQPHFCVTVLRTRQAGTGQVRHWWPVAVMVGQPVGCVGAFVVW
jgi:hypothetical protein